MVYRVPSRLLLLYYSTATTAVYLLYNDRNGNGCGEVVLDIAQEFLWAMFYIRFRICTQVNGQPHTTKYITPNPIPTINAYEVKVSATIVHGQLVCQREAPVVVRKP